MKKTIITALIIVCTVFVNAQLKFTISPPKYELFVSPNETKTMTVTVNNLGDSAIHIKVYESDWTIDFENKIKFLPPGTIKNSCSGWFYINPQEFNIDGQSYADVRVTLNVPDNVYGDYWSLLFFESSPISFSDKPAVAFNSRVGCTFYSSINGTVSKNGEITSMDYSKDKNTLKVGFENLGNIHLRAKGFLQIFKDSVMIYEKNITDQLILPEMERNILFPVDTYLKKGSYTFKVYIDYGGTELLEGEKTIFTQ